MSDDRELVIPLPPGAVRRLMSEAQALLRLDAQKQPARRGEGDGPVRNGGCTRREGRLAMDRYVVVVNGGRACVGQVRQDGLVYVIAETVGEATAQTIVDALNAGAELQAVAS